MKKKSHTNRFVHPETVLVFYIKNVIFPEQYAKIIYVNPPFSNFKQLAGHVWDQIRIAALRPSPTPCPLDN